MIGQVDPTRGYVHVLDDTTVDVLLQTLDTIGDFTAYLTKKEEFIKGGHVLEASGEEEVLAYYLTHLNSSGDHDFVIDGSGDRLSLPEGPWQNFVRSSERTAQLRANRISYIWDDIIERFTQHFLQGTSQFRTHSTLASHELILRFFAREPRTRRRMLMSSIVAMIENTPPTWRRTVVLVPTRPGDPHYVFVIFPLPAQYSYDECREMRMTFLEACCRVVKLDFPDALDIVGFATETSSSIGRSEDAAYFDARLWTDELAALARKHKEELGILRNPNRLNHVECECPV
jgi:hypothetical protein